MGVCLSGVLVREACYHNVMLLQQWLPYVIITWILHLSAWQCMDARVTWGNQYSCP